ncbi:MAG TPA: MoaD/ThiS family protein [Streptosporangiaceae bacterium]
MAMVTVRYWAAAKQAAGIAEESLTAGTLAEALSEMRARHAAAPDLAAVLARSSFLIDGERASHGPAREVSLRDGAVIEVLPPFAGG